MGLVDDLDGASAVALDTPVLIYYFQDQSPRVEQVAPIFERLDRGEFRAVISTISLAELLIGPLREGESDLAHQYSERLRRASGLDVVAADTRVAEQAAELRCEYNFSLPDAIVVATAVVTACSHLVTNDASLARVESPTVLLVDSYTE